VGAGDKGVATQMDIKAKTIRSVTAASGGHILRKILDLAKHIILARLLIPEDFGIVALALFLSEMLRQIGSAGLSEAVIQRHDADERTLHAGFTFSLISSVVFYGIVWFTSGVYAKFYDNDQVDLVVKVLGLCMITRALGFIPETMLVKQLDFRKTVIVDLLAAVGGASLSIVLAVSGFGYWSIVYGIVAKSCLTASLLFVFRPSRVQVVFDLGIARRLFPFGIQIVLTSILVFLVNKLPDAIIGGILGTTALGYYFFAFRWANIVAIDIGQVLGKVLYPAFSLVQNQSGQVKRGYLKALKYFAMAMVPCSIGMAGVAPEFVVVVLGEKWSLAVGPMQILCFAGLLKSLGVVGGAARRGIGRPEVSNYLLGIELVVMVLLVFPMTYVMGFVGASVAVLITSGTMSMVVFYVDKVLFGMKLADIWAVLKHPFSGSAIMFGLIAIERAMLTGANEAMALGVFISTGILSYSMYTMWSSPELRTKVVGFPWRGLLGPSEELEQDISRQVR